MIKIYYKDVGRCFDCFNRVQFGNIDDFCLKKYIEINGKPVKRCKYFEDKHEMKNGKDNSPNSDK